MENLKTRYLGNLRRARDDLRHAHDMALLWSCADTYALIQMALNRLMGSAGSHGYAAISRISRELHDLMLRTDPQTRTRVNALVDELILACDEAIADAKPHAPVFGRRAIAADTPTSGSPPSGSPASGSPASGSPASGNPAPDSRTRPDRRPLLLIVDDDESIRDLLSELFGGDARLITAINADEAYDAIRRHRPSLVLLDDIMPGSITGLTLLERLDPGRNPDVRVIMITASDSPHDQARGHTAGALDYITKPFDIGNVYARVMAHLVPA